MLEKPQCISGPRAGPAPGPAPRTAGGRAHGRTATGAAPAPRFNAVLRFARADACVPRRSLRALKLQTHLWTLGTHQHAM